MDSLGEPRGRCREKAAERDHLFRDRYGGSKDPSNVRRKWEPTLAFGVESGAVQMVPFGGRRYLSLPSFGL